MTTITRPHIPTGMSQADLARRMLRTLFAVAPILFGLDKFANVLVDWDQYLAPWPMPEAWQHAFDEDLFLAFR